ncbi:hypothetical protein PM082_003001 [Marasmius tenuissimus]|nr:hypothetical protein PM082_003001 [Marasmius tenuissimus]
MHQVISRPLPKPASNTPPTSRTARKSSSSLNLRREKEKDSSQHEFYQSNRHNSPTNSPDSPTHFDAPSKANRPGPSRPRSQRTREAPSYFPYASTDGHRDNDSVPGSDQDPYSREFSYSFPSGHDVEASLLTPRPTSSPRPRSRTGSSPKPNYWIERSIGRRISTTSTQYTETIPDTPSDSGSIRLFPVEVAAPVPGVETMDALVDGLNGGDEFSSRSRIGLVNHHPLYQPPLPTPPPGVILGAPKIRRSKKSPKSYQLNGSDDDEHTMTLSAPTLTPRKKRQRPPSSSRSGYTANRPTTSASTPHSYDSFTPNEGDPNATPSAIKFPEIRPRTAPTVNTEKHTSMAPSISDIIRAYTPRDGPTRSRVPLSRNSSLSRSTHATVPEDAASNFNTVIDEESDLVSRSSFDSIADEVQRTLRNQTSMNLAPPPPPPPSYSKRHSVMSDSASLTSPRSDGGGASIYSSSIASTQPPLSPFDSASFLNSLKAPSPSQEVAQYLRSTRLTTLLKLTRSPHASHDNPLTVSLSDLGSPKGYPVLVFLGLGCVRHIMGLYDEMAECLGLRMITIDRWGLGRTEPRAKSAKGIMQWASVVEEVLDILQIEECSVMAHSAGAPYALSFANKLRKRIRGDVCLLAPWVGGSESGGYKWLKYVPNGILKTAQAAEWKLQTWMIGKPPTIAWEGIGYNAQSDKKSDKPGPPRPSTGSAFSEYDDLRDFDGRFESRSTLGVSPSRPPSERSASESKVHVAVRKTSRGFLSRLKNSPVSQPQSPPEDSPTGGKRLKALRSMGSLKSRSSKKTSLPPSPQLPDLVPGIGFDDLKWNSNDGLPSDQRSTSSSGAKNGSTNHSPYTFNPRAGGRRSISFTSASSPRPHNTSFSSSPRTRSPELITETPETSSSSLQSKLANALIAASHSESSKGTHNDLLQILNHENHPWGFSYQSYPHRVRVWYGDKDEKIAENAVRWMERTMGDENCIVKVVKSADHGLMYNSGVVVEVLEFLQSCWQEDPHRR